MAKNIKIKKTDPVKAGTLLFGIYNKAFNREFDIPSKNVQEHVNYLKDKEVWIIYKDEEAIGFFDYKVEGGIVEIDTMAMLPEYQRSGIGQIMMKEIFRLTKGRRLKLVVHPANSQAVIFYLKSGFKICGWINDYYGDGEPRLRLERSN